MTWQLLQTFAGSNDNGLGQFGAAVATDGDMIVVGAPRDNEGEAGLGSGAAYLLQFVVSQYELVDKVKPAPDPGALFGTAVSIADDRVVVGGPNRIVNLAIRGFRFARRESSRVRISAPRPVFSGWTI